MHSTTNLPGLTYDYGTGRGRQRKLDYRMHPGRPGQPDSADARRAGHIAGGIADTGIFEITRIRCSATTMRVMLPMMACTTTSMMPRAGSPRSTAAPSRLDMTPKDAA